MTTNQTGEIKRLIEEFDEITKELINSIEEIQSLVPVSYQKKHHIPWAGGIVGAVREHNENKRILKIMMNVIYKDEITFFTYPFFIEKHIKRLVEIQVEIQKNTDKENNYELYYGNANAIVGLATMCISAWANYSDAAYIKVEDGMTYLSALDMIDKEIKKMDLPPQEEEDDDYVSASTGCLGVVLILLASVSLFTFILVI